MPAEQAEPAARAAPRRRCISFENLTKLYGLGKQPQGGSGSVSEGSDSTGSDFGLRHLSKKKRGKKKLPKKDKKENKKSLIVEDGPPTKFSTLMEHLARTTTFVPGAPASPGGVSPSRRAPMDRARQPEAWLPGRPRPPSPRRRRR